MSSPLHLGQEASGGLCWDCVSPVAPSFPSRLTEQPGVSGQRLSTFWNSNHTLSLGQGAEDAYKGKVGSYCEVSSVADAQDLWPVKPEPEGSCPALSYLPVLGAWP